MCKPWKASQDGVLPNHTCVCGGGIESGSDLASGYLVRGHLESFLLAWMVDATFPLIQIAHTVSDNLRLALYLVPCPPHTPLALPKSFQPSRPTDNVVFTILCARMKTNRLKVLSSPGPSLLADDLIHSTPQCSTSWWLALLLLTKYRNVHSFIPLHWIVLLFCWRMQRSLQRSCDTCDDDLHWME